MVSETEGIMSNREKQKRVMNLKSATLRQFQKHNAVMNLTVLYGILQSESIAKYEACDSSGRLATRPGAQEEQGETLTRFSRAIRRHLAT
jgi:hypothetical protein